MNEKEKSETTNFIRQIIDDDLKNAKHTEIHTRFPPEPNGYIHLGHVYASSISYGIACDYNGSFNLRFDDTNPEKEEMEFIASIQEDLKWLGFNWEDRLFYASDYFDKLYEYAIDLIRNGKAYVCDLTASEVREYRGTLKKPGTNSPYRDRSVEENLELFEKMKSGKFDEGRCTLRAKIDMSSPNMNMRDPAVYRIKKIEHPKSGNKWCIYPMYDYTHCISDALEKITHSLCSLEFEDHRPLYDWYLDQLKVPCHPQQIEFGRFNLDYTIMSKRHLQRLVEEKHVNGWDDPRMPTVVGMRRRGYTPEGLLDFCKRLGVTKKTTSIDFKYLEQCIREDLSKKAPRVMGVVNPLKVVITNWPEEKVDTCKNAFHPEIPDLGEREFPMTREIYIERDDFLEIPPKKFFRLAPGKEVRLRYSWIIKCEEVVKNDQGEITELKCTYDEHTRPGESPADGRKVKGVLHWVSASGGIPAEIRLYDRLFTVSNPATDKAKDIVEFINQDSCNIVHGFVEPSLISAKNEESFQFERLGYFCIDRHDSRPDKLVFNRTVTLRDSWTKINK
ncbi:MAG: glutamine--tRNA ligase/YqeY domain fusion protein [Bacteriovoracaceae bacterium]|nr:glutamine--tRNA ligase/YqeY domain fusion protein [Bacteriovoracaceae bacterium]